MYCLLSRSMLKLKSYVCNKSRPEWPIVEEYLTEECMTFIPKYLTGLISLNRPRRNREDNIEVDMRINIFTSTYRGLGSEQPAAFGCTQLKDMHKCVIFNCDAIGSYLR